jgi:hypothetical protein
MFWKQKPFPALILTLAVAFFSCQAAYAENEGQNDLDKASETKVNATGIKELSEVIKLLDSASSLLETAGVTGAANSTEVLDMWRKYLDYFACGAFESPFLIEGGPKGTQPDASFQRKEN